MQNKYEHVFRPLKVNNIMWSNRIIASPMGHPKTHITLSSTYYGGISIYDKALGGSGAVTISTPLADENCQYEKYSRDEYKEDLSVMKAGGAKAVAEVTMVDRLGRKTQYQSVYTGRFRENQRTASKKCQSSQKFWL